MCTKVVNAKLNKETKVKVLQSQLLAAYIWSTKSLRTSLSASREMPAVDKFSLRSYDLSQHSGTVSLASNQKREQLK